MFLILLTSCSINQPLGESNNDAWNTCKEWVEIDSEVYMDCMLLEQ